MNITGKIVEIYDIQEISNSFKKREFVVEYADNPSFPEFIKFELIQDRCVLLDAYNTGDEVTVNFNLKGRKWPDPQGQTKYFNSLQAWRIEELASDSGSSKDTAHPDANQEPEWLQNNTGKEGSEGGGENELPF